MELFHSGTEMRQLTWSGWLGEVALPVGLTKIEEETFEGCYDLSSVTFLGKVTHIENKHFTIQFLYKRSICQIVFAVLEKQLF